MNKHDERVAAVSVIAVRDGRFLLVCRGRAPLKGMYAFPGGHVMEGERLEDAALRELHEETALAGHDPRLHKTYEIAAEGDENTETFSLSVFVVEIDRHSKAYAGDDAAALGWYTADEARGLPVPDSVRECIDAVSGRQATI